MLVPRLDFLHHPIERCLKINPLPIRHTDEHEEDVGHLHVQVALGLACFLGLLPEAVVHLPSQLAHFLGEAGHVRQRVEVSLLELAYPGIDSGLEVGKGRESGVRSRE
jgi:hypothetical protein